MDAKGKHNRLVRLEKKTKRQTLKQKSRSLLHNKNLQDLHIAAVNTKTTKHHFSMRSLKKRKRKKEDILTAKHTKIIIILYYTRIKI